MPDSADPIEAFLPLFEPRAIAIVGASAARLTMGNMFLHYLQAQRYPGDVYLIHPEAKEIEGYPVLRSFRDVPRTVDYAYVAVSPQQILGMMPDMKQRVRFAQIISSGFGETDSGRDLENMLVQYARDAGVRILGPNCLGLYSPRGRVTFLGGLPNEGGSVGLFAQSGGLSIDILRRGTQRGVGFSAAVTLGNSADVQPWELLEYFLVDPSTHVVAGYLEDAKNGRKFFEALHARRGSKPVVALIGGMTPAGRRVAHSHTGALAGDERIWRGIARQTGLVLVKTVDEMIDVLLTFQTIGRIPGPAPRKVVLFGNGGGASVLGADILAMNQLELAPFSAQLEQALVDLRLPAGSSIANPIDTPAVALRQDNGGLARRILDVVVSHSAPDVLMIHLNLPALLEYTDPQEHVLNHAIGAIRDVARQRRQQRIVVVLRSDGFPEVEAQRRQAYRALADVGLPVFDEIDTAARGLKALREFEEFACTMR